MSACVKINYLAEFACEKLGGLINIPIRIIDDENIFDICYLSSIKSIKRESLE